MGFIIIFPLKPKKKLCGVLGFFFSVGFFTFNPGYYTKLPALALLYEHTARILVCGTYPELITV